MMQDDEASVSVLSPTTGGVLRKCLKSGTSVSFVRCPPELLASLGYFRRQAISYRRKRAKSRRSGSIKEETMGQVMTLCTSDEADEHGYDKTTVEKASPPF